MRAGANHLADLPSAPSYRHFYQWCEMKNLHLVALWHRLDTNDNMSLHKMEFVSGLKELRYDGDIELLWSHMDQDHTQTVSFFEFAPEHALELSCFKCWAENRFGSVQAAFSTLDVNGDGRITLPEFKSGCVASGLPELLVPTLQTLFIMLDSGDRKGKGTITKDELAYLDAWGCPTFLTELPDFAAREALKKAVVRRHGKSPLMAWRRDLDKDGSMRVNLGEFTDYCRKLARQGIAEACPPCGTSAIFCAFDQERTGWFSLREWDHDSYKMLVSFQSWARENHGKVTTFVRSLLQGRTIHIDFQIFARAARGTGLRTCDLPHLFDSLCGKSGRLTPADVAFLDRWDPERDRQEREAWDKVVQARFLQYFHQTPVQERAKIASEPGPLANIAELVCEGDSENEL